MTSHQDPCPLYTSSDPNKWIDVCHGSDTLHVSSGCGIEVETQDGRKFTFNKSFAAQTAGVGYDAVRKVRLFIKKASKAESESQVALEAENERLKEVNKALKTALEALAD